jgi:hypothetical protein
MGGLAAKNSAPVADKLSVADQPPEAEHLEQAIAQFQSNPDTPSLLRNLAREHPNLFFALAAKHLESVEAKSLRRPDYWPACSSSTTRFFIVLPINPVFVRKCG